MASFTDIVPQFNPYVSKFPLELIGQAGMYKQKKYEDNVQKIQGEIDKIAGLDILRDVDKAHLQSRLNELGNSLTSVSAGDFSNFQLVNSVSGMTKQLVRDKNIETAVSSTAWYRKQAAEMEKAISEGKSSQSNIWDFNSKANKYMSSTDLGRSFSERYTPYTDVRKKAMESIKALHPNLQSVDIPFVIRPDGSIDTTKIADAMVRNKVEGISENQIKQAIYASLDENDQNQLSIDGRYRFKDVTPQKLGENVRASYESSFKDANENLQLLESMKRTNVDPKKSDFINQQIEYYNELLGDGSKPGTLYENYTKNIQSVIKDPDGVKTQIYKDGFVKEFANAFTWKNEEKQLLTNPYKQQENWAAEMKQKQYEFTVNKQFQQANLEIARENLKITKLKNEQESAQKIADKQAKEFYEKYGILAPPTPLTTSTMDEDNASEVYNKYLDGIKSEIDGEKATLGKLNFKEGDINRMLNLLIQNRSKEIDERALPSIIRIAKNEDLRKDLQDAEAQIVKEMGHPRGQDDLKAGIKRMVGRAGEIPILGNSLVDFNLWLYHGMGDQYKKDYNKRLAQKLSNVFIPTQRSLGVKEDGTLTATAITGLLQINERQKAAGLTSIPDELFTDKGIKNTKAYIKQSGKDYSLIVKSVSTNNEYEIPVSANDISRDLGSVYLNNTQDLSMRLAVSPDLSASVLKDPNRAYFKQATGDFPNLNKLSINATLLADPENPGTFIYEAYPLKKDGTRVPVRLTGKNRKIRFGRDQALVMNDNLTDQELLNMFLEQDPNFDIKQLEGVD